MNFAVQLEVVGGPQDGMTIEAVLCSSFTFSSTRMATGEVTRDIYALEVHDGRFRLKFLSTQCEPVV